jgi:hypothetical protein
LQSRNDLQPVERIYTGMVLTNATAPNEALSFHSSLGFDHVPFTAGGVYTIDDVSFGGNGSAVPQPGSAALVVTCVLATLWVRQRRKQRSKSQKSDGRNA